MKHHSKPVLLTVMFKDHITVTKTEKALVGRSIPLWAPDTMVLWEPTKLVVLNNGYVRSSASHLLVDDLVLQYVKLLDLLGFTIEKDFRVEEEYKKGNR